MRYKCSILFIFFTLIATMLFSQENIDDLQNPDIITQVGNSYSEQTFEENTIKDYRYCLNKYPIYSQIDSLPFIDKAQKFNLYIYLTQFLPILSYYELYEIKGWDAKTISKLKPYLTLDCKRSYKKTPISLKIYTQWESNYPEMEGFSEKDSSKAFEGLPFRNLVVVQYKSDDISFQLGLENDIGEKLYSQKGGTLKWDIKNHTFYFGNYYTRSKYGLLFWDGYKQNTSNRILPNSSTSSLKKASPLDEIYSKKGLAYMYENEKWNGLLFYSYRDISTTIGDDSTRYFTSFIHSGNFRNQKEKRYHLNTALHQAGGKWGYKSPWIESNLQVQYSLLPKNYFSSKKIKEWYGSSIDYEGWISQNYRLSGEHAYKSTGYQAHMVSLLYQPSENLVQLSLRYLRNHIIQFENSPYKFTSSSQEKGLFLSYKKTINYNHSLLFGYDFYKIDTIFSKSNHRIYVSNNLTHNIYSLINKYTLYSRNNQPDNAPISALESSDYIHSIQNSISFYTLHNSRVKISHVLRGRDFDFGQLFAVDFQVKIFPSQKLFGGFRQFEIDDWDNRIYFYEKSLPYKFSLQTFYNSGSKWYLGYQLEIKNIKGNIKLEKYNYTNINTVGSNQNTIHSSNPFYCQVGISYQFINQ